MMKGARPLHERLRCYAEKASVESMFPTILMAREEGLGYGVNKDDEAKIFMAIADEIEQNYELREGAYAPKRLGPGADDLPIREGDEVYVVPEHAGDCGKGRYELGYDADLVGYRYGEMRHAVANGYRVDLEPEDGSANDWCPASWLTHTPPDTQERIDKGKRMDVVDYWDCSGVDCLNCTLGGDGVSPAKRYGVFNCVVAQGMDIARRQAELDALLGGDA